MLPIDMPTRDDVLALAAVRADACVSIYLETTPVTTAIGASRTALRNALRDAAAQLEAAGLDKRRLWPLVEQVEDLEEDDAFWAHQAHSLAVLVTPDRLHAFRLANRLAPSLHLADRFHLKPLLRSLTHSHDGFVLALDENGVRLVEFFADAEPIEVRVADMPRDAASAVGKASINDRSHSQRIVGSEGKKVRLRQYARAVDAALRAAGLPGAAPVVLASNSPLDELFRSVSSLRTLLPGTIGGEIGRLSTSELVAAARPVVDSAHAAEIADLHALRARRAEQGRATSDIARAARAAARGAIESLLVDIDRVVPGTVDEESGAVAFAAAAGPESYGVTDWIATAALATGARVLCVRSGDLPEGTVLAATLRYAV
jgi:hypothetical protein